MQHYHFIFRTTLGCLFILLIASNAYTQNLIQDGQFKEGINHWTVLLSNNNTPIKAQIIEHSSDYGTYGLADNYVNTNFVELDAASAIQQNIATKAHNNYILTFAYAHRPDAGKKQLVVLVDQTIVYTETVDNSSAVGTFKYKTVHFTPHQDNSKISFYAVSLDGPEDQGILITDLSCEIATEIHLFDAFNPR